MTDGEVRELARLNAAVLGVSGFPFFFFFFFFFLLHRFVQSVVVFCFVFLSMCRSVSILQEL